MNDARKTDALLRRALGGVEAPDQALLRQVKASLRKEQDMKTNKTTKRMLTLALAAALVLALSVTAYAAYMASVEDYIIEPPATVAPGEAAEKTVPPEPARLSMVGYQGTPEYEAYVEWEQWQEENPTDFSSVDNDDSYYETEKNYAALYDAPFKNQAEKLDEIMAKYGLTPLEDMHAIYAPEEVYDALGTEPFLPEGAGGGGYLYNDGTFKLEAIDFGTDDLDGTLFVSVKGSFARISGSVPTDYAEWSYTTDSCETVDLVMGTDQSLMLLETDGAYIDVAVHAGSAPAAFDPASSDRLSEQEHQDWLETWRREDPSATEEELEAMWQERYEAIVSEETAMANDRPVITAEQLEAIADSIGFDVLAKRFDGSVTRERASEDFYAFIDRLESATDTYNRVGEVDEAIAVLGDYYLKELPDGYFMYIVTSVSPEEADYYGYPCYNVERGYDGPNSTLFLSWRQVDETLEDPMDPEAYAPTEDHVTEPARINDCDGVVAARQDWDGRGSAYDLTWVDPDEGLVFRLRGGVGWTRDEMLAMAGSVTPAE